MANRSCTGPALRRYIEQRSRPAFSRLAEDGRGLPAVHDFFAALIEARCSGAYARWGCMVSNAHAGGENGDPGIRAALDRHHAELREALRTALTAGVAKGQLQPGTDPGAAADLLALLAYGVNLRSRSGADAGELTTTVTGVLDALGAA
ncbi:TetR family transcriptional regulator C-terminal domain-containing protein [Streptomyces sp. NPDC019531]|uniref:TetR family transcriptional regulator C-terminal domain-containing protein n=1 Tax=Streptomyces sp. NPDC019531 TaxID=3365062 RepID=UPI003851006F